MKKFSSVVLVLLILGATPGMAFAGDPNPDPKGSGSTQHPPTATQTIAKSESMSLGKGIAIGLACVGAGIAAIGGGFAVARIGGNCIESMARQPEAAGAMFAPMIVTAAMVEGGMLFAIVVCLLGVLGI